MEASGRISGVFYVKVKSEVLELFAENLDIIS